MSGTPPTPVSPRHPLPHTLLPCLCFFFVFARDSAEKFHVVVGEFEFRRGDVLLQVLDAPRSGYG